MTNIVKNPSSSKNLRKIVTTPVSSSVSPRVSKTTPTPTPKHSQIEPAPLDKLAQLTGSGLSDSYSGEVENRIKLRKRAKAKYITNGVTNKLSKLDSPLHKSYVNTYFCASELKQSGQKLTGNYCNNRWCIVCNRIRTAKLIHGYKKSIQELPDKQFLTLTIPNVPAEDLPGTIKHMIRAITLIVKRVRVSGKTVKLLRKLECTYNPTLNNFHPHFHLIVSGKDIAEMILAEWLKSYPAAKRISQDIRPADDNSVMELFKYFSKIITKKHIYADALDVIFRAMHKLRVFQPVGVKKTVTEDIEELQSAIYDDLQEAETIWTWIENDWVDVNSGEYLTGYEPSKGLVELLI